VPVVGRAPLTVIGLLSLALLAAMSGQAHAFPSRYTVSGATAFPEGVAAHTPKFWVSSFRHGTIYLGDVHSAQTHVWLAGQTAGHPADGRTQAAGMKVSADGTKLYVAGGQTGYIWVYDTASKALIRRFYTGHGGVLNEVALAPDGTAYVTDSERPYLYRIDPGVLPPGTPGDTMELTPWVNDLPAYTTVAGITANANGVVANAVNVIYVQSNTGQLWKVNRSTKAVTEITVDSGPLKHGDGMIFDHNRLLVVRNSLNEIDKLTFSASGGHATVADTFTSHSLRFPTGIAALPQRMLVVNSQMDKKVAPATPVLPFTVSAIPRPVP
jgi:DNA-binding beta-propeller fold protein YncE